MLELSSGFNTSNNHWMFDDGKITDTKNNKVYTFRDSVLCHDDTEEAVAIWKDCKHVDTVRCDSFTYNSLLSRFEKTLTYIPLVNEMNWSDDTGTKWRTVRGGIESNVGNFSFENLRFELDGDKLNGYHETTLICSTSRLNGDALIRERKTYNDHHTMTIQHASIGIEQNAAYDDHDVSQGIMITTETTVNLPISARLGIISAEAAYGMNIIRDIRTLWSDKLGGRNKSIQTTLKQARAAALEDLKTEANALGGDAVIAVDLDYSEFSGGGKNMMFCVASGTVVRLKRSL